MLPGYFALGGEEWQEGMGQIDVYSSMLGGRLAELTYWRIGIAEARRKACVFPYYFVWRLVLCFAGEDARTTWLGFSAMFLWRSPFIRISCIGKI